MGRFFIFLHRLWFFEKTIKKVSTNNMICGQDIKVLQYSLTIEK
jgi:hypothetical protein